MLEEGGIATVVICSEIFRERMLSMNIPRLIFTHTPLGRPLGAPGNKETQSKILVASLELLASAKIGGSVIDTVYPYF